MVTYFLNGRILECLQLYDKNSLREGKIFQLGDNFYRVKSVNISYLPMTKAENIFKENIICELEEFQGGY